MVRFGTFGFCVSGRLVYFDFDSELFGNKRIGFTRLDLTNENCGKSNLKISSYNTMAYGEHH
jgi:hypothetical protein